MTLDPELTDSNGIPAPKVTYTLSENSRKMLDHGLEKGTEVMKAAGAWDIQTHAPIRMRAGICSVPLEWAKTLRVLW